MLTESLNRSIPLPARRVFRLSLVMAVALVAACAMRVRFPFLAPIFALVFSVAPAPPMKLKDFVGLALLVFITSGAGLLLVTTLRNYPFSGVLIVSLGLFMSNYLTVNKGKKMAGVFLTIGLTLITAAGMMSFEFALIIAESLIICIGIAVICQWVAHSLFPEDPVPPRAAGKATALGGQSSWIALRATLIVLPSYLAALINPSLFLPIIMKAVSLGQQIEVINARDAGRELLGSTFTGGVFAILFWLALGIEASLWMFFLWMLLFGTYFASKLYRIIATSYPPSFWRNAVITMLILLGPAVNDRSGGKDVFKAMAVRMALFIAVTVYAWIAFLVLENLRARRVKRTDQSLSPEKMS